ncbi:MAG UNVERIFIED_CONTAM: hypothetical protein LVQ98_04805 [Rickettsiaceae bacterium]
MISANSEGDGNRGTATDKGYIHVEPAPDVTPQENTYTLASDGRGNAHDKAPPVAVDEHLYDPRTTELAGAPKNDPNLAAYSENTLAGVPGRRDALENPPKVPLRATSTHDAKGKDRSQSVGGKPLDKSPGTPLGRANSLPRDGSTRSGGRGGSDRVDLLIV